MSSTSTFFRCIACYSVLVMKNVRELRRIFVFEELHEKLIFDES
jgi:hypothetical protein